MIHRHVAAKLPEPLFLQLKTTLAHHDLSVRDFITKAAEVFVSQYHPITNDELEAVQDIAEGGDGGEGYKELYLALTQPS